MSSFIQPSLSCHPILVYLSINFPVLEIVASIHHCSALWLGLRSLGFRHTTLLGSSEAVVGLREPLTHPKNGVTSTRFKLAQKLAKCWNLAALPPTIESVALCCFPIPAKSTTTVLVANRCQQMIALYGNGREATQKKWHSRCRL